MITDPHLEARASRRAKPPAQPALALTRELPDAGLLLPTSDDRRNGAERGRSGPFFRITGFLCSQRKPPRLDGCEKAAASMVRGSQVAGGSKEPRLDRVNRIKLSGSVSPLHVCSGGYSQSRSMALKGAARRKRITGVSYFIASAAHTGRCCVGEPHQRTAFVRR
jgi:hypothetical protein